MDRTWGTTTGFIIWLLICIQNRASVNWRRKYALPPPFLREKMVALATSWEVTFAEVWCYSSWHREKSSHLRLPSIYLNSAKFSQFVQKDFCGTGRCHLYFPCMVILHPTPALGLGQLSQRWSVCWPHSKMSSNTVGKPIRLSGVSRAILVCIFLEHESFIQILDNIPVLITSGTRLEFRLSGSIIYGHGNTARGRNTQSF